MRDTAGAGDCPKPAAELLSGALQVEKTAQSQQLSCSLGLCRRRRLPSSCATLWSSAGARGCSAPTGVWVSKALQEQEAARRQQVCGYARHCRCTRLLSASRCVGMRDPAGAEDWLKPAAAVLSGALQAKKTAQQLCYSLELCRCTRLLSANRRVGKQGTAGAGGCPAPTGVWVCEALQVHEAAQRQ